MTLRFGIIGCGMIANFHARALRDCPLTKLVACYSRDTVRGDKFATEYGCTNHSSLQAMLQDPNVDAVSICSASGAHLDPAIEAAKAGKHVIVEKPLEVTAARCDQIIAACKDAGVRLGVTFQSRFHRSSQLLKEAIVQGRFGRITLGDAYVKWYRSQEYYDSGAWRGTWELDGGGALMNQAIHSVDLLLWLMGPVASVSARIDTATHQRIEVEDVAVATLKFRNGALGVIEATTTAFPGALKRIEICGNKGSVVLEEEDLKQWQFADEQPNDEVIRQEMQGRTTTGGGAGDPAAIGHHGHCQVFNDFAEAVRDNRDPLIDGSEARHSVELIEAIYRSARENRTVDLPSRL